MRGFKFISVKFLWGPSHRRPHSQILWGPDPWTRPPRDRHLC